MASVDSLKTRRELVVVLAAGVLNGLLVIAQAWAITALILAALDGDAMTGPAVAVVSVFVARGLVGWAGDVEEITMGEASVAAPIRGYGGLVVGAIGISGPVERICDSHSRPRADLVTFVRDAARAVSRDLGAPRW